MTTDSVIATRRVAKHYGDVRAVDGIDLDVRRGEVYGFLGRNGAGKTTTIRMLMGLIRPTSGEISVLGTPIRPGEQAVFARVGTLVETATSYPNLTVQENLAIQRRLTGAPAAAVDEVIALLGLGAYVGRRAGQLSLGNKQRLALARALLHRPDLLVLDEPANALDPAGIVEIRGLLRRLADERGVTVFMSSHILAEVAHLADRIGIIHHGKLIEELDREALAARARKHLIVSVSEPDKAAACLAARLGIDNIRRTGDDLRLDDDVGRAAEIARVLVTEGFALSRLNPETEDLEEHFLRLMEGAQ